MLLMHSKVPCNFAMPEMKHTIMSRPILVQYMVMMLHTAIVMAAPMSSCWLVKRNFILNSNGK